MRQLTEFKAESLFPLLAAYKKDTTDFLWPSFIKTLDKILKGKTPVSLLNPSELYQLAKEIHDMDCTVIAKDRATNPKWVAFDELRNKLMPYYVVYSDLAALKSGDLETFTFHCTEEPIYRFNIAPPSSAKDRESFQTFKDAFRIRKLSLGATPRGEAFQIWNRLHACVYENPSAFILDLIRFYENGSQHAIIESLGGYAYSPTQAYLSEASALIDIMLGFECFSNDKLKIEALKWLEYRVGLIYVRFSSYGRAPGNPLSERILSIRIAELNSYKDRVEALLTEESLSLNFPQALVAETRLRLESLKERLNTSEYTKLKEDTEASRKKHAQLDITIGELRDLHRDTTHAGKLYLEEGIHLAEFQERNKAYLPQLTAIDELEKELDLKEKDLGSKQRKVEQLSKWLEKLSSAPLYRTLVDQLFNELAIFFPESFSKSTAATVLQLPASAPPACAGAGAVDEDFSAKTASAFTMADLGARTAVPSASAASAVTVASTSAAVPVMQARAGAGGPPPLAYAGEEGCGNMAPASTMAALPLSTAASSALVAVSVANRLSPVAAASASTTTAGAPAVDSDNPAPVESETDRVLPQGSSGVVAAGLFAVTAAPSPVAAPAPELRDADFPVAPTSAIVPAVTSSAEAANTRVAVCSS